jgi:hypothetical protein
MAKLVQMRTDGGSEVFIASDTIARIYFTKVDTLPQSERKVNITFRDGTKGEFIAHRNVLSKCYTLASEEKSE